MTFRVHQKVECVSLGIDGGYGDEIQPEVGGIYTVRDIRPSRYSPGEFAVHLCEIHNSLREYDVGLAEIWFRASRFRPIVARKTSIEIFTRMLTPTPQKESAQ